METNRSEEHHEVWRVINTVNIIWIQMVKWLDPVMLKHQQCLNPIGSLVRRLWECTHSLSPNRLQPENRPWPYAPKRRKAFIFQPPLVGGWTNPFWKIWTSNWIISPGIGVKIKKCLKPPPSNLRNGYGMFKLNGKSPEKKTYGKALGMSLIFRAFCYSF